MRLFITLIAFFLSSHSLAHPLGNTQIGVNYSDYFAQAKHPDLDMQLLEKCKYLQSGAAPVVKLFDDTSLNTVITKTPYKIILGTTNQQVTTFANNAQAADAWVTKHLTNLSSGRILSIAVGNEVFNNSVQQNVPKAIDNLYAAL